MPMNTELDRLRQQMAALEPGPATSLTENVAPMLAKALGYIELIRAVMPAKAAKPVTPKFVAVQPAPPPGRVVVTEPRRPALRRTWQRTWRNRLIGSGVTLLAGAVGYAVWRYRAPSIGKSWRLLDRGRASPAR